MPPWWKKPKQADHRVGLDNNLPNNLMIFLNPGRVIHKLSKPSWETEELRHTCTTHTPHLLALTKTWLIADILDSKISIIYMTVYRGDRTKIIGVGDSIYIATIMSSHRVHNALLDQLPDSTFYCIKLDEN